MPTLRMVTLSITLFSIVAVSAAEFEVTANPDLSFTPDRLVIQAGDSVRFTNRGGFHNVHADDDRFRCAESCDDQQGNGAPSRAAWSFTRSFDQAGEAPYYCEIHGAPGGRGMSGLIEVQAREFSAALQGRQQVPAMVTGAHGSFHAVVSTDRAQIVYRLHLAELSSPAERIALHIGQPGVNGGELVSLCGSDTGGECPSTGELQGSLDARDIKAVPAQGMAAADDMPAFLRALSQGSLYVLVASQRYPAGELRGQLMAGQGQAKQ